MLGRINRDVQGICAGTVGISGSKRGAAAAIRQSNLQVVLHTRGIGRERDGVVGVVALRIVNHRLIGAAACLIFNADRNCVTTGPAGQ